MSRPDSDISVADSQKQAGFTRPAWDDFFKGLAVYWSQMSTCSRRQVGAVVVKDRMVLGEGFNGVVSGKKHCIDGGCPRGQHYKTKRLGWNGAGHFKESVCACGVEWPCPDAATPGADYNQFPCSAIHAEANALYRAGLDACDGATLYVNAEPCLQCTALIERFGIAKVVVV